MTPYRGRQQTLPGICVRHVHIMTVRHVRVHVHVPAVVRNVPAQARQAPRPVRMKFRVHMACLVISLAMMIMGLIIPLDALVITSPAFESVALATVERLFSL